MKRYLLIFNILFFNLLAAQQAPDIEWARTYGGSNNDWGASVQKTNDGGYIIAGATRSDDGDISEDKGGWDYWVIKTDAFGEMQWEKTYGGSWNDNAYHIEPTIDGGYIIAGHSNSDDGDIGFHYNSTNYSDIWIVKIDEYGNIEWEKSYGGFSHEWGYCIKQTTDGGYIVAGYTVSSSTGDVTGNNGNGTGDFWIFKITETGILEWQKNYGGGDYERAFSIVQTSDSGYIVTGQSHSGAGSGDVGNHFAGADYWVVKIDNLGNIEWERSYGGSQGDYPYSILETPDGGYIVAGKSYSSNGDISQSLGNGDAWVVKLDEIGNIEWERSYGGSGNEGADFILSVRLIEIPEKGYFLVTFTDSVDFKPMAGQNIWVFRLDYSGNIIWTQSMGGSNNEFTTAACLAHDGGFVITGGTRSGDGIFSENKGGDDLFLIKLGPEQMAISETKTGPILIYPNPVKDILHFSEKLQNIDILSVTGQKVLQDKEGESIDVSHLPSGTYLIIACDFRGNPLRFKFIKN